MKKHSFEVLFHTGDRLRVSAFGEHQALILAKAAQIQAGKDYAVKTIRRLD